MKKRKEIITLPPERETTARRRSRQAAGPVKPARPITPKTLKPPKHRRPPTLEGDEESG